MTIAAKKRVMHDDSPKSQDATTLPRADHKLVSGLFAKCDKSGSVDKKKELGPEISTRKETLLAERA